MALTDPFNGVFRAPFAINYRSFNKIEDLEINNTTSTVTSTLPIDIQLAGVSITFQLQVTSSTNDKQITAQLKRDADVIATYVFNSGSAGNSFLIADQTVAFVQEAFPGNAFSWVITNPGAPVTAGQFIRMKSTIGLQGTPI